ncbi:MAG TPA: hypothetical protein VHX40_01005, partial [Acidimicrobiales bacterium]|nr:hypothetical protein [Acidimicrobiales bacterium]
MANVCSSPLAGSGPDVAGGRRRTAGAPTGGCGFVGAPTDGGGIARTAAGTVGLPGEHGGAAGELRRLRLPTADD